MYRALTIPLLVSLLLSPLPTNAQATPAVITDMSPSTYFAGTPVTITINGQGFSTPAQIMLVVSNVYWTMHRTSLTPTSASFTPPSYLQPGNYPVLVRTQSGDSNRIELVVTARTSPSPIPSGSPTPGPSPEPTDPPTGPAVITTLTPASLPAGSATVVTVSGTGFTPSASVHIIVDRAWWTMRIVGNTLTSRAFIPPTYLRPGSHPVVVRTIRGDSNALTLTVVASSPSPLPSPTISPTPTISPFPSSSPTPTIIPTPTPSPQPRTIYTAFGDSLGLGFFSLKGYVAHFHDYLASLFTQPVQLRNLSQAGWTSQELRVALQTNTTYRQAVTQADVITWNIGGNDLRQARQKYQQGSCGGPDNQDCLRQSVERFQANWSAIIAEMRALSPGQPKLIRTMDVYNPYVDEDQLSDSWPNDGGLNDFTVLKPYVDQVNSYIARVTPTQGITVAPVYTTFNGASGNEDPENKGYISFIDDFHPDTDGHSVISQLLTAITP